MELYSKCVTCVMENVLQCAERLGVGEAERVALVGRICREMASDIDRTSCSPILTEVAYGVLREFTGIEDPFAEEKRILDEAMSSMEERFFELSSTMEDPIEGALVLSGTANLMDLGAFKTVDPDEVTDIMAEELLSRRLPRAPYEVFLNLLGRHRRLLIIGDNCGEIVLDKVVIRRMKQRWPDLAVTYGVRGRPILNDATEAEAKRVGMNDLAAVVSTGVGTPGFVREMASSRFGALYDQAPLVLAKGVGNFEAADFGDDRVFHLFVIKCETLSLLLERPERHLVFMSGRRSLYRPDEK